MSLRVPMTDFDYNVHNMSETRRLSCPYGQGHTDLALDIELSLTAQLRCLLLRILNPLASNTVESYSQVFHVEDITGDDLPQGWH